jgi:hypothetical protein
VTFQLKLAIVTLLAVGMAVTILTLRPVGASAREPSGPGGPIALWLGIVAGALVVVGVVSHTLLRHLIQIAPLVAALGLLLSRSSLGVSAAAPLFSFWLLIMGAIWLFLLGIARIFTGTFTPAEVTLTIVIGVASALGLAAAWRQGPGGPTPARLSTVIAFAVLQFAAMWISVQVR